MKFNYSLVSMLAALVLGLVLLLWPDVAINYLILSIGVVFFVIPSLIAFLSYYFAKEKPGKPVLLLATGSFLFGLFLLIRPDLFANILMVILGVVLLVDGVEQLSVLFSARKLTDVPVPWFLALPPVLLLCVGAFSLFSPVQARNTLLVIVGMANIIYAVFEFFIWMRYKRRVEEKIRKAGSIEIVDAEIVDEAEDSLK